MVLGIVVLSVATVIPFHVDIVDAAFARKEPIQTLVAPDAALSEKRVVQTHYNKALIPQKVYDNIAEFAAGYKHIVFDDSECIEFLKRCYEPRVAERFNTLSGPHKADLFRYAYLYIHGGVYLDIKNQLLVPLDTIFDKPDVLFTALSFVTHTIVGEFKITVHQGVISAPPGHPIFLRLLKKIVELPVLYYMMVCCEFERELETTVLGNRGLKAGDNGNGVYLLTEKFDMNPPKELRDWYGYHSQILKDGKAVIKTRYDDYPWTLPARQ